MGGHHDRGFVVDIAQVSDGAKSLFAFVIRCGVQHDIAAGHTHFHLQHFFRFDLELLGNGVDLLGVERAAVHVGVIGVCISFEALLHRAQIEEQFALGFGGGHLDHAPVFQNVFMDFGFDPVHGIAHQAHPLVGIKALDGFHQADIAFLDQVAMGQAIA